MAEWGPLSYHLFLTNANTIYLLVISSIQKDGVIKCVSEKAILHWFSLFKSGDCFEGSSGASSRTLTIFVAWVEIPKWNDYWDSIESLNDYCKFIRVVTKRQLGAMDRLSSRKKIEIIRGCWDSQLLKFHPCEELQCEETIRALCTSWWLCDLRSSGSGSIRSWSG